MEYKEKLLVDFLKLKRHPDFDSMCQSPIRNDKSYEKIAFSFDWNWLMKVVENIRHIDQSAKGEFKTKLLHYQRNNKTIFDVSILEGKESVYKLSLEFVNWYNENLLT